MSKALPLAYVAFDQTATIDPTRIAQEKIILQQLLSELTVVQKRLGKPQEQEGDCQLARDIGHTIRNKLHVLRLVGAIEDSGHGKYHAALDFIGG